MEDHNHDDRYFTELEIMNLLGRKADLVHSHNNLYYTKDEVNNSLLSKANVNHTHTEYYTKSIIQEYLAGKSNIGHHHDTRYYTQTQIDAKLQNTNLAGHNHDDKYFTKVDANNRFISRIVLNSAASDIILNLTEEIEKRAYGIKYVWENEEERLTQTKMKNLEQGLQVDTKEVFSFDGTSWNFFYLMSEEFEYVGTPIEYIRGDGSRTTVIDGGTF